MRVLFASSLFPLALAVAACGGGAHVGSSRSNDSTSGSDGGDSPSGSDGGNGAASQTFPAFAPEVGQLVNQGGTILASPKFVTVTWTADPNEATLEALDDQIGGTPFWQAATSEYGIGPAVGAGHVEISDAPFPMLADTDLATYIQSHVAAAPGNGWPAPDDQTVYVVYLPESTSFTSNGADACDSLAGYHDENVNGAQHTMFAVIAEGCHDSSMSALDAAEVTATHELAEVVTDPHIQSDPAWSGFDTDHLAWSIFNLRQEEVGDACQFYPEASVTSAMANANGQFPFGFQRLWSNAAGAAGSDPCVFASDGPHKYFNVTPLNLEDISVVMPPHRTKATATKGYHVSVGSSATFQVGFYSDGPVPAWNLSAVEDSPLNDPKTGDLTFAIDVTSGANGQVANVTVTVNSQPLKSATGILMTLVSTAQGMATHDMPVIIETD